MCRNRCQPVKDAWRDSVILGYHCRFGGEPMTELSPKSQTGKVLLRVRPRGFCAGVVRAVDIVELALEAYGPPVYVHHEIVHNRYVVEDLRKGGAIFVEAVEDVPEGAVLVFSAHGVPPAVRAE